MVKKDKDDVNWELRDADKDNPSSANNQPQAQASKKDMRKSRQRDFPATKVNVTKVAKKDKDKAKDLSHIECYTCKQKSHYANKDLEKSKN